MIAANEKYKALPTALYDPRGVSLASLMENLAEVAILDDLGAGLSYRRFVDANDELLHHFRALIEDEDLASGPFRRYMTKSIYHISNRT